MKQWRPEDKDYLRENWGTMPVKDMRPHLDNRSSNSIEQQARKMGLVAVDNSKLVVQERIKPKRREDATKDERFHMDRISLMPCLVANSECKGRINFHHVREYNSKRDHRYGLPLCELGHHLESSPTGFHKLGRKGFEKRYKIDTMALAKRLWADTQALLIKTN